MQSTVITAEARILGTDQTGGAFASVHAKVDALTKKFGQVGKAAAISAEIDKLNAALAKTQNQLAGVQKLQTAEDKLARLATRNAQQKAIAEEQASARTAAAAQRAAAAYYKQLDAVNALKRNLEGAGVAVTTSPRPKPICAARSTSTSRRDRAAEPGAGAGGACTKRSLRTGSKRLRHAAAKTGSAWGGSHRMAHRRKRDGSASAAGMRPCAARRSRWRRAPSTRRSLNRVRNVSNSEDEVALARPPSPTKATAANPYTTRTAGDRGLCRAALARGLEQARRGYQSRGHRAQRAADGARPRGAGVIRLQAWRPARRRRWRRRSRARAARWTRTRRRGRCSTPYVRAKQVFGNAIQAHRFRDFVAEREVVEFLAFRRELLL
jgi:hypothetical protein